MDIKGLELCLSHAGLVRALLQEVGLEPGEQGQVFDQILDGDTEVMRKIISKNPQLGDSLSSLFELKSKSPGFLDNLKAVREQVSPNLRLSIENFITIAQLLNAMGYEYQIDMASADGFEYYTGVVFQFYIEGRKIGGGGRYNDLVPLLGGGNVPASGFALYIDQLMNFLPIKSWEDTRQRVLVKGEVDSTEKCRLSFEVASLLRGIGYIVELDQNYTRANDYRWVLMIQSEEKPPFILTDQVSSKSIRADSPTEILNVLKETKANEASSS